MAGFVIMHRDILDWEWYQSPTVSRLYFHLILKVNYTDKKWQGILVKRGQLVTSNNHLAIELKLSIQIIRTAMQKLQEGKYIGVKTTNRFTLITLHNYDKFQSSTSLSNKQNNNQITDIQQSNNKQTTTTKEGNNEKKVNKEKIEVRLEKFKNRVFERSQYNLKILQGFYDYWSELNSSKTKMRCEKDGFFNVDKRLKKWSDNEKIRATRTKEKSELLTNR